MFEVIHAHESDSGPIFLWGMYPFRETEPAHTIECARQALPHGGYTLIAYCAKDWNRDFSPWPAPDCGTGEFPGGGKDTLRWLEENLVPQIRARYGPERAIYPMGYSLAGLFSLWAACESDSFAGAVCCSGSLWYPGWADYAAGHGFCRPAKVYLSLGGREEKSPNPYMARVGECTRVQERLLEADPHVEASILEWNSGGHFADSGKRLAKGMSWICRQEVRFSKL